MSKRKAQHEPEEEEQFSSEDDEGESGDEDETSSSDSGDDDSFPDVSDEPEDGDGDDSDDCKEIDVDFEFYDPKENDFHGLKALLGNYLDGQQFSCSQLVDTILSQQEVGTLVKTGEEEAPVAVCTVLNLDTHRNLECMKQVCEFLVAKCSDVNLKKQIQEAFQASKTGLLLNERLINFPSQVAAPLLHNVLEELSWAQDDPDYEGRFAIQKYIVLSRVFFDPLGEEGGKIEAGPSSGKKSKKQKAAPKAPCAEPFMVFVRPEDEKLHSDSTWSFTFPVEDRPVSKDELTPHRLVMLVSGKALKAADEFLANKFRSQ